jgi:hypothetical protein
MSEIGDWKCDRHGFELPYDKDCPACAAERMAKSQGAKYDPNNITPPKQIEEPKALDVQVGGGHYKDMAIQPMEYSMKNGLDACQHTAIKYISRFRDKGGIEDLRKAKHVIDMLIQFEEEKGQ